MYTHSRSTSSNGFSTGCSQNLEVFSFSRKHLHTHQQQHDPFLISYLLTRFWHIRVSNLTGNFANPNSILITLGALSARLFSELITLGALSARLFSENCPGLSRGCGELEDSTEVLLIQPSRWYSWAFGSGCCYGHQKI